MRGRDTNGVGTTHGAPLPVSLQDRRVISGQVVAPNLFWEDVITALLNAEFAKTFYTEGAKAH